MSINNKITFDSGVKQYEINGKAYLRFNPSDPNVYKRFKDLLGYLTSLEKEVSDRSKDANDGFEYVDIFSDYDKKVKEKLQYVFGPENDFDAIFENGNVMALASNGETIVTNFLEGLRPIIEDGIKAYARLEAKKAAAGSRQ